MEPFEALELPESMRLDCGAGGLLTFQTVWAPGHCPDHHVIFCPEKRWLFAGDMFVTPRPRLFRFEEVRAPGLVYGSAAWSIMLAIGWCRSTTYT